MAFQLRKQETVASGIVRLAHEQLAEVLARAAMPGRAPEERVHDMRTHLKQVRTLARLVRDAVGDGPYRQVNRACRDAGRPLAAARDATVVGDTLDRVAQGIDGLDDVRLDAVRRRLLRRRERLVGQALGRRGAVGVVRARCRSAERTIEAWQIGGGGFDALAGGLHRIYRAGRRAMRLALQSNRDEDLHEWRKQAKYCRYAVRVVSGAWRGPLEATLQEMHHLTDALGEHHDLATLARAMAHELGGVLRPAEARLLRDRLGRRQADCRRTAAHLGVRIYAEQPGDFVGRLGLYWAAWR